ncbi:hypothetical protein DFS34DRAFT_646096 [Phlyctochytrium arcticum]|nr:hypothetical protein DFS34DRAFT_646096 [Phlyctochytrium arcticum]
MARQFHFRTQQDRTAQFLQNIIGLSEARFDDASAKFRDLQASFSSRYLVGCIGFDKTDTGVATVQRTEGKLMGTINVGPQLHEALELQNVEERLSSYENATHDFVTKLDPLVHEAGVRAAAETKEDDTQEEEEGWKADYSSLAVLAAQQAAISNSQRLTTLVEDVVCQCKEQLGRIDTACHVDKYMSAGITTTPRYALILDIHRLVSNFCGEALSVYIDTILHLLPRAKKLQFWALANSQHLSSQVVSACFVDAPNHDQNKIKGKALFYEFEKRKFQL